MTHLRLHHLNHRAQELLLTRRDVDDRHPAMRSMCSGQTRMALLGVEDVADLFVRVVELLMQWEANLSRH